MLAVERGLGGLLERVIDRQHHVAAGLRLDAREQVELLAVRVDEQVAAAGTPAQIGVEQPLDAAAADDVAEPVALELLLAQLLGADLAEPAEQVRGARADSDSRARA